MEAAEVERLVLKPTAKRRLGRYVLLGRLGHGGMGKIYLAYSPGPAGIEKLLVIKRLHSHLTSDAVLVNNFLDEARLSMVLSHPNIVHTYDVGDVDGRYFMVMEYIDGQNLGVVLRTAKRANDYPSSVTWAGLFMPVLDALHAAHTAKDARGRPMHIIHRDVSPQNVLITYEGIGKLVDFGIAKAAQRLTETDAGVLKGKYAYMSPEQVRGEPLDPRSDLFAAGIVFWEMLAGRRLYKADTIVRSVERILGEAPILPIRVNPECDPALAKIAFKAIQKDRNQRFASAAEFRDAIEEVLRQSAARFRPQSVRDLMQRLFHDVMLRQRAVLDGCLSGNIVPADDEGPSLRRPSDSASDVQIPQLRVRAETHESTTPSSIKASPLITSEGEVEEQPKTNPQRRGNPSSQKEASVRAAAPLPPVPLVDERPPPYSQQPYANQPVSQPPYSQPPGPRRRGRVAVAALLALCIGALLPVVAWFHPEWLGPFGDHVRAVIADARGDRPAAAEPTPAPPPPVEVTTPPPSAPAGLGGPIIEAQGPDPAEAHADERKRASKTERRPPPPREKEKVIVEKRLVPRDDPPPPSPPPPPVEAPVEVQAGFLTLDTVPWTSVYLGKKKLGDTPLMRVQVPSGTLELLLVNPGEGIKEPYVAKVKVGENYRARLDLQ